MTHILPASKQQNITAARSPVRILLYDATWRAMSQQTRQRIVPASQVVAVESLGQYKPKDLATHLRAAVELHSEDVVSTQLLDAVAHDLAPSSVFAVWLNICRSPKSLFDAIRLEGSVLVRLQAIKHFAKALNTPAWKVMWDGFGGTPGLLELFTHLSVRDIATLCRAIGSAKVNLSSSKAEAVTELLRGLLPRHYPDAYPKSSDSRPLVECYAHLLPACTTAFVVDIVRQKGHPLLTTLPRRRLVRNHIAGMKQYVLDAIFDKGPQGRDLSSYCRHLLYDIPELPSSHARMSASMSFSLDVLHLSAKSPQADCRPNFDKIVESLLRRAKRRRVKDSTLVEIISTYIDVIEGQKAIVWGSFQNKFFGKLIELCSNDPSHYERLVTRYLRVCALKCEDPIPGTVLRLCIKLKEPEMRHSLVRLYYEVAVKPHTFKPGTPATTAHERLTNVLYTEVLPEILVQQRYALLRLHHYRSFSPSVDIDEPDSFKNMPRQSWPPYLFAAIPRADAVRLLQNLIRVSPEHSFLSLPTPSPFPKPDPGFTSPALLFLAPQSILAFCSVSNEKNLNALLLLAMLEQGQPGALEQVKDMIEDFKTRATKSRDQVERAGYARAAILFAISSGSLDLYGDAIVWSRRFLRDALTMRTLVQREILLSSEGIELLSGIAIQSPSLKEATANARVGNAILLEFSEMMRLAKKEPQFQDSMDSTFHLVKELFGQVVRRRIERAPALQRTLKSSDGRLYSALWSDTFAMLTKVESDYVKSAHWPVINLWKPLPPAVLFTLASAILDVANANRTKETQSGDDTLDRLTYETLELLIDCDRPRLASSLVLRIIMERPEASSWHRRLLPVGYFKRLSARDAQDLLESFANAIATSMDSSAKRDIDSGSETADSKPAPTVKVTTVKHLAQLLDNAKFVNDAAAVDILSGLFKNARHIDVRAATLNSIVSRMMNNTTGLEQLFSAMESLVPISGSLNERFPTSVEAWQKAKSDRVLPEIWEQGPGITLPPLLESVLSAITKAEHFSSVLFDRLWTHVLGPIVAQLHKSQTQWISLFADFNGLPALVPLFPYPDLLIRLFRLWPTKVQQHHLHLFQGYVLYNIAPPPEVEKFSEELNGDPARRTKPEYRKWLNLYDRGSKVFAHGYFKSAETLFNKASVPSSTTISPQMITSLVVEQARVLLSRFDIHYSVWSDFLDPLAPPKVEENATEPYKLIDRWETQARPVVLQLIALIESVRSVQWKQDPNRVPSILPSTFKLQLWTLAYPDTRLSGSVKNDCVSFASALLSLIASVTDTRELYPAELVDIEAVSRRLTQVQKVHVAHSLGIVIMKTAASRLDFLRVELSEKFYRKISGKVREKESIRPLMDQVVQSWAESSVEEFRAKALAWKE